MIIDLNIKNKNVLVIGAGIEGTKKIKLLLNQKCNLTIISEEFDQDILSYEKKYDLQLIQKKIEDINILNESDNLFMVFATTNNKYLNRQITRWAKNAKILAYSIDDYEKSDFALMSIINIDELIQIAISTSGKSPIMNKIIKLKIENVIKNIIGKNDIDNIKIQEFARIYAKKYIEKPNERKDFLYSLINNQEIQELLNKNSIDKVKERIINILDKLENNKGR
ncbi:MAG TPA: bifunctional precorrin-2 dehydrogenase/sirohydrochlorin ferrochelatase [Candidatus Nitrosocosmicus sp.]